MNFSLDYRKGFLCVRVDKRADIVTAAGPVRVRKWFPIRDATEEEVTGMVGQTLTLVDQGAGLYVHESAESYTLQQGAATQVIEVEIVRPDKATGSNGKCAIENNAGENGRLLLTYRGDDATSAENGESSDHRETAQQLHTDEREEESVPEASAESALAAPVAHQLSLKQKLAEVRRRIGQIEKRGINEDGNYRYVRAADLAGAVGDVLAELGVILLPRPESISTEPLGDRTGADHLTRVIISYTFMDANSTEELTIKVAGEGVDPGDKSVCKAQTSALKYALLQSFLIATGDDPEEGCATARNREKNSPPYNRGKRVSSSQAQEVLQLIGQTGTQLERVLEYFRLGSLNEMTQRQYSKALAVLRKKLVQTSTQHPEAA